MLEVSGHLSATAATRWNALVNAHAVLEADSRLNAYRLALAREFPPNEDGDYDLGNVHANLRQLKENYRRLLGSSPPFIPMLDATGDQCVPEDEVRLHCVMVGEHIKIEYASKNPSSRWAVRTLFQGVCLSHSGEWVDEPSPSNRSEEWLRAHRFHSLKAAVLAAKTAPSPAG
ncbi:MULTISPECIES: hypothetical protein [Achromobacter]|uniref:hypothetical protein n=1 Tax=Achromobacter TaxID=222 RepID=UPI0023F9B778|nr:hypothetical protein [Achromobacter anxifer]MDF8363310.1 hypothetical protein [Achromobacter anxifer]